VPLHVIRAISGRTPLPTRELRTDRKFEAVGALVPADFPQDSKGYVRRAAGTGASAARLQRPAGAVAQRRRQAATTDAARAEPEPAQSAASQRSP
jgi:hypothetical protein